ncbi:MAG: LysR family transcriptional regulator [Piscinibacter sp.]|nr:LysR family transcriptional regulator [Piscinibacter sp.]
MDTVENLRAFLCVARTGSFSAAARELGVAASVVTKRVAQLEHRLKAALFERTTRRVSLTSAGRQQLPAIQRLLSDLDGILVGVRESARELQGRLRVKAPTSMAVMHLAAVFNRFQRRYPLVSLELVALDRAVNPVDEGFDLALTMMPDTFAGVIEEPLCAVQRLLCAAPAYLKRRGTPRRPSDLVRHDIINFLPTGAVWTFQGPAGDIGVPVHPRFDSNDAQLVASAALAGNGIAVLGDYLALPAIADGTLVRVLGDHPLPELWLKAQVPENRAHAARLQALLAALRAAFTPRPPWAARPVATVGARP